MSPSLAEYVHQPFGGAVNHLRLAAETRRGYDEAHHLKYPFNTIERAKRGTELRQSLQDASPRLFAGDRDVEIGADLAEDAQFPIHLGDLIADPCRLSVDHHWQIVAGGRNRRGKHYTDTGEAAGDYPGYDLLSGWRPFGATAVSVHPDTAENLRSINRRRAMI